MQKKYTIDDFTLLTVLGKGLYGKIFLVRETETQNVYALKVLKKSALERKNKSHYVFSERNIMIEVIRSIRIAFSSLHYPFSCIISKRKEIILFVVILPRRLTLLSSHSKKSFHIITGQILCCPNSTCTLVCASKQCTLQRFKTLKYPHRQGRIYSNH